MSHTDFEQSGHAYLQSTVYSVVSWKTVYSVVSWITILSYLLYLLVMFSHFLQALLMDGVSAGQNCYIVPWFKQVLQQNQYCRFVLEGCSIIPWWEVEEKLKEKIPQNKWGSRDALLLQHKGDCSWEGLSNNSLVDSQIVQVKRFSGGQRKKFEAIWCRNWLTTLVTVKEIFMSADSGTKEVKKFTSYEQISSVLEWTNLVVC